MGIEDVVGLTGPRPYVGDDRRQLLAAPSRTGGRSFARAGGVLLVAWLVLSLLAARFDVLDGFEVATLSRTIDAATMAIALVASTLTIVHWRLSRDARALWIGVGFALLAVASVGISELLSVADISEIDSQVLAWMRPASMVVVLLVLTQALRTPQVDMRLQPIMLYTAAFCAVGALTLVFQLLPPVSALWAGVQEPLPTEATSPWAPGLTALLWVILATAYCMAGFRRSRHLLTYSGLLLYGLTLAELARVVTIESGDQWLVVASVMRALAVSVGLLGITTELRLIFARLSSRLFEVNLEHQTVQAQHRADLETARERAHEARNALTAIEGATKTLERYRDDLGDEQQRVLAQAVSTEVARLQNLVSDSGTERQTVVFRLSDVIRSQVMLAQSRGMTVLTEVPTDLFAKGLPNETAEALQNLLTNAERHAPGSPVTVRARADRSYVTVRVEDRGRGVAPQLRQKVFERGERSSQAEGSGLGLYVASRLFAEQGGDLWYEDHPAGGACFAFRLPAEDMRSEDDRPSSAALTSS